MLSGLSASLPSMPSKEIWGGTIPYHGTLIRPPSLPLLLILAVVCILFHSCRDVIHRRGTGPKRRRPRVPRPRRSRPQRPHPTQPRPRRPVNTRSKALGHPRTGRLHQRPSRLLPRAVQEGIVRSSAPSPSACAPSTSGRSASPPSAPEDGRVATISWSTVLVEVGILGSESTF